MAKNLLRVVGHRQKRIGEIVHQRGAVNGVDYM